MKRKIRLKELKTDKYVWPGEAMEILGVARLTIYRWIKKGWLRVSKTPGGHRRITRKSVEFMKEFIDHDKHFVAEDYRQFIGAKMKRYGRPKKRGPKKKGRTPKEYNKEKKRREMQRQRDLELLQKRRENKEDENE